MNGREVTIQIGTQRNNAASQFPSQLSDPSFFDPQFVSTPKGGNKEDRSEQGAEVQPSGGALPDLVKYLERK